MNFQHRLYYSSIRHCDQDGFGFIALTTAAAHSVSAWIFIWTSYHCVVTAEHVTWQSVSIRVPAHGMDAQHTAVAAVWMRF